MEILVAIACLLILGGAMTAMLRSGVGMWRDARARRVVYDRAQTLFGVFTEDLQAIYVAETPPGTAPVSGQTIEAILQCGYDANKLQALSFVRTISEAERAAGLPDQGLIRVSYTQEPRSEGVIALNRAMSTPSGLAIGGPVLITDDLLYLGVKFWTPETTNWSCAPSDAACVGPSDLWDSTRGSNALSLFQYYVGQGSLDDPSDDVFPPRIRTTVVLEPRNYTAILAKLQEDLSADATGIVRLDTTLGFPKDATQLPYLGPGANQTAYVEQQDSVQYVKIGSEWIHYDRVDGNTIIISQGGRGARGTANQTGSAGSIHPAGSLVHVGKTFTFTYRLPTHRERTDICPGCN